MKRFIVLILGITFLAGSVFAYPTSTGAINDTPQAGLWKTQLSANQVKGANSAQGGVEFKYVYNGAGTTETQGHPAFWTWDQADDYSVGRYVGTGSYEAFAGIWYCDAFGATTISNGSYGWIQTRGVGNAYVSGEGSAVAKGDVMKGSTANETSLTAGNRYLTRSRAAFTTTPVTAEATGLTWPKALETMTAANTVLLKKVFVCP